MARPHRNFRPVPAVKLLRILHWWAIDADPPTSSHTFTTGDAGEGLFTPTDGIVACAADHTGQRFSHQYSSPVALLFTWQLHNRRHPSLDLQLPIQNPPAWVSRYPLIYIHTISNITLHVWITHTHTRLRAYPNNEIPGNSTTAIPTHPNPLPHVNRNLTDDHPVSKTGNCANV